MCRYIGSFYHIVLMFQRYFYYICSWDLLFILYFIFLLFQLISRNFWRWSI